MSKTILKLKHEFRQTLKRKSYIIMTLAFPLIALLAILVFQGIEGAGGPTEPEERINVFFTYTPKQFLPNVKKIVEFIGPIIESKDIIKNDGNLTLIVGLDNNYESVNKLTKDINPRRIYAFVPEPAFAEEYSKSVLKKNKPLLEKIGNENIIKYPAGDPELDMS